MQTNAKGYLLGAIAAATYGMNPLFALPLYQAGMTPDSVLFFRYLFALPMLATMIRLRGRNFRLQRTEGGWLVVMGLLMALSSLALFQSYNYMEAGIASTLLFVYPVMVAILMATLFHERMQFVTWVSILMVLAGIFLLYKAGDGSHLSITGTMLVGVSALAYAIYIVAINHGVLRQIATLKVTFYVILFGLSLFAVRLLVKGDIETPTHWYLWGHLWRASHAARRWGHRTHYRSRYVGCCRQFGRHMAAAIAKNVPPLTPKIIKKVVPSSYG